MHSQYVALLYRDFKLEFVVMRTTIRVTGSSSIYFRGAGNTSIITIGVF